MEDHRFAEDYNSEILETLVLDGLMSWLQFCRFRLLKDVGFNSQLAW